MKYLQLLGSITFLCCFTSPFQAQMTIGTSTKAANGSLLQLKSSEVNDGSSNAEKGLLLPRVELVEIDKAIMKNASNQTDFSSAKDANTGIIVYNLTDNTVSENDVNRQLCVGPYVWEGSVWTRLWSPCTQANQFHLDCQNLSVSVSTGIATQLSEQISYSQSGNPISLINNQSILVSPDDGKGLDVQIDGDQTLNGTGTVSIKIVGTSNSTTDYIIPVQIENSLCEIHIVISQVQESLRVNPTLIELASGQDLRSVNNQIFTITWQSTTNTPTMAMPAAPFSLSADQIGSSPSSIQVSADSMTDKEIENNPFLYKNSSSLVQLGSNSETVKFIQQNYAIVPSLTSYTVTIVNATKSLIIPVASNVVWNSSVTSESASVKSITVSGGTELTGGTSATSNLVVELNRPSADKNVIITLTDANADPKAKPVTITIKIINGSESKNLGTAGWWTAANTVDDGGANCSSGSSHPQSDPPLAGSCRSIGSGWRLPTLAELKAMNIPKDNWSFIIDGYWSNQSGPGCTSAISWERDNNGAGGTPSGEFKQSVRVKSNRLKVRCVYDASLDK
ncbi:hypothetical protein O2K51_02930 [Apibacter raozihei]|uniref:hypothetical protein n=1 Tax=Apibacter raozihei TaxID=2500547 RepID=UPI000FE4041D|nr:hypothetical protein [Apibacter raozihei]